MARPSLSAIPFAFARGAPPRFPFVEPAETCVASLRFALPASTPVCGGVLTPEGRLVRVLLQEELAMGEHTLRWDGRDGVGMPLPAGIYTIRLEAAGRMLALRSVTLR